jgi:transposase
MKKSRRKTAVAPRKAASAIATAAANESTREKIAELVESKDLGALLSLFDSLTSTAQQLAEENERQKLRIKLLRWIAYGRKTEKLSAEDVEQLALAFGASEEEARQTDAAVPHPEKPADEAICDAASTEQDAQGAEKTKSKKRRTRRTSTVVEAKVERVVTEVPTPVEERTCSCCHREMKDITHVDHETIVYVPAKFVVQVERRKTWACRHSDCRGDIHTTERPVEVQNRRKVDAALFAQLIEGKCHDALPIERQRDQYERMGVSFPLNTLYSYWTYATTLLSPVAKITCAQVLADPIVAVDDTKLRVLDKTRAGGSYKGCLWCFAGTRPLVAYTFTESWEASAIAPYIGAIEGFIQCDDYKGYSSEIEMPDGTRRALVNPERRLGCMMHVRRRFHEAMKLGDKRAAYAVELIGRLYEIEAEAKARGLDSVERLLLRIKRSLPLLDDFDKWVDEMKPKCTPTSPLAQALGYAAQQRAFIRRCFTDGRFEIDNGHVERAIRRPCIGRNNYLFTGSPAAAERLADAYTLVLSCRNLGISVRDYLIDVINKLEANWPMRRIGELVPDTWARLHGPLAMREQSGQ